VAEHSARHAGGERRRRLPDRRGVRVLLAPELRLLAITGFLGGLTTFSTFSLEVVTAAQRGDLQSAAAIVVLHLLGSLACTAIGIATFSWSRAT
jgi:fluoride ion exporter CrcB/FEX